MTGNENRRITRQKARLYHKNKTKPRKKKKERAKMARGMSQAEL
jgi:hypothetical protein